MIEPSREVSDDLAAQLEFLHAIDRLKRVIRQSPLLDRSRKENSAEHSWHLALYALVLSEHARQEIDLFRVVKMLLVHDLVEIDAGDMPIHGAHREDQTDRERAAARRLFGLLPHTQREALHALWDEFECAESADAQFAKALDRLQPLLVNVLVGGGTWAESAVTHEQVLQRYGPTIERGAPTLWRVAQDLVARHFADSRRTAAAPEGD
jgi:putative hydrolase of HD superfamily